MASITDPSTSPALMAQKKESDESVEPGNDDEALQPPDPHPNTRQVSTSSFASIRRRDPLAERTMIEVSRRLVKLVPSAENLRKPSNDDLQRILAEVKSQTINETISRKPSAVFNPDLLKADGEQSNLQSKKENLAPTGPKEVADESNKNLEEPSLEDSSFLALRTPGSVSISFFDSPGSDEWITSPISDKVIPLSPIKSDIIRDDSATNKHLLSLYSGAKAQGGLADEYLADVLEDQFTAQYRAAFDVYYNSRRFFEDKDPGYELIGLASLGINEDNGLTGKSIYDVFIDSSVAQSALPKERELVPKTATSVPLTVPAGKASTIQADMVAPGEYVEIQSSGFINDLPTAKTRDDETQLPGDGAILEFASISQVPTTQTDLLDSGEGASLKTETPLPEPKAKFSTLRHVKRVSPRVPASKKKSSPAQSKNVMAWWKEKDAAVSTTATPSRPNISKTLPGRQSSQASFPSIGDSVIGTKGKEKEKGRNPLRRLSSFFLKSQEDVDQGGKEQIGLNEDFHRSTTSLSSQFFLPELEHDTQSFITADIVSSVRNRPISLHQPSFESPKARREPKEPSSMVKQRISSFETPSRPTEADKKHQTSPSWQILNTIKPVRGGSLREVYERRGVFEETSKVDIVQRSTSLGTQTIGRRFALAAETFERKNDVKESITTPAVSSDLLDEKLQEEDGVMLSGIREELLSSDHDTLASTILREVEEPQNESGLFSPSESEHMSSFLLSPNLSVSQVIATSTPLATHTPSNTTEILPADTSFGEPLVSGYELLTAVGSSNPHRGYETISIFPDSSGDLDNKSDKSVIRRYPDEENKENIPPDDSYCSSSDAPSVVIAPPPKNTKAASQIARFEADAAGYVRDKKRYVLGSKDESQQLPAQVRANAEQDDTIRTLRPTKKRFSVWNLFRLAKSQRDPEDQNNTSSNTPSFRILPAVDPPQDQTEERSSIRRSLWSIRLGRKKKPILAVPKYPKRSRSRASLFGLFTFGKPQQSSFVVHQDPDQTSDGEMTPRPTSPMVFRELRRRSYSAFNKHMRYFSAPSTMETPTPQVEVEEPVQRPVSPPPRLELKLSHSGFS